jgi:LCP family protein required for cell wall assembly
MHLRRPYLLMMASLALGAIGLITLPLMRARAVWDSIERVTLAASPEPQVTSQLVTEAAGTHPPQTILLVGSDSRDGLDSLTNFGNFEGARADVIILAGLDDAKITLLSIPRDLYVDDSCGGGRHKLGEALTGCEGRSGLGQLVSEVEKVLAMPIDHALLVDMAGFQQVVDRLGGYEICVDRPIRDNKAGLNLAAGCSNADGATTLAWLRSRNTLQKLDGGWRAVPGVSDLERNARQRQFLLEMLSRATDASNPGQLLSLAEEVAPHLTMDSQLELREAVRWGWLFRSAEMTEAEIPVVYQTTDDGASVLVPDTDLKALARDLFS